SHITDNDILTNGVGVRLRVSGDRRRVASRANSERENRLRAYCLRNRRVDHAWGRLTETSLNRVPDDADNSPRIPAGDTAGIDCPPYRIRIREIVAGHG